MKTFLGVLGFLGFMFMVGSVGSMELETISAFSGTIRAIIGLIVMGGCARVYHSLYGDTAM